MDPLCCRPLVTGSGWAAAMEAGVVRLPIRLEAVEEHRIPLDSSDGQALLSTIRPLLAGNLIVRFREDCLSAFIRGFSASW